MQSSCMTDETVHFSYKNKLAKKPPVVDGHMANLSMKVNSKLGNINHFVASAVAQNADITSKLYTDGLLDTIILGADVVHTQKESADGTPSLAAIVGSIDKHFSTFLGSMRAQKQNTEVFLNPFT